VFNRAEERAEELAEQARWGSGGVGRRRWEELGRRS
jgi:hypothetical protein